jgi:hypothetical protein
MNPTGPLAFIPSHLNVLRCEESRDALRFSEGAREGAPFGKVAVARSQQGGATPLATVQAPARRSPSECNEDGPPRWETHIRRSLVRIQQGPLSYPTPIPRSVRTAATRSTGDAAPEEVSSRSRRARRRFSPTGGRSRSESPQAMRTA